MDALEKIYKIYLSTFVTQQFEANELTIRFSLYSQMQILNLIICQNMLFAM